MEPTHYPEVPKSPLNVPIAIVVAGIIIAGAIMWTNRGQSNPPTQQQAALGDQSTGILAPVTSKDHILGNPQAKVMLVEFSDASCPYCKIYHATVRRIIDEYGKSGNVAWVYRHFPIDKPDAQGYILHKNAGNEAHAMECAADLGGNDAFWSFTNRLYEVTPSVTGKTPEGLDQSELPNIAAFVGLDKAKFQTCMASGKYKEKIENQYLDGVNAGVAGTPYSFIVTKSGKKVPINGAQPYAAVKAAIEAILSSEI